ncbi:MAG: hypothetical protein ACJ8F7_18050 [Gemmataceae bacterium]
MDSTADRMPFNGQPLTDDDLAALRTGPAKRPPRHKPGESFLKGPIPWRWIERAARLPGKALAVGLMLWKEAGCEGTHTVRFRSSQAAPFGCHADTARRGLEALQTAGLVAVRYVPGRCLEVTLLDVAPDNNRA